jgi:hypothetical protein
MKLLMGVFFAVLVVLLIKWSIEFVSIPLPPDDDHDDSAGTTGTF